MKANRMIRVAMLAVVALLVMPTGACSWFKKGKKVDAETAKAVYQTPEGGVNGADVSERPGSAPLETPRPVGLVDADQFLSRIQFDYNVADIKSDQLAKLERNLKYLLDNADVQVLIEGHCDERGSTEYNFALGDRRAAAVMEYFVKGGVAAERLQTLSKGEEEPAAEGHDEAAWSQNRRAQFKFISNPGI